MRHYLVLVAAIAALTGGAPVAPADPTGAVPSGPIVVLNGAIYGATEYGGPNCPRRTFQDVGGCGTVYEVDADGKHAMLHAFAGPDGANPSSGVVAGADGMLYGTTDAGGDHGHGVIYRTATDGSGYAVLYSFATGAEHGTLTIEPGGTIYGVAPSQHGDGHGATVFALSKDGDYRTLRVFGPESHVASPLAIDSAGQLYGILVRGGYCGGDVFSLSGNGAYGIVFSNAQPYTNAACAHTSIPTSPLIEDEGSLYATDGDSLYAVAATGLKTLFSLPAMARKQPGPFGKFERIFVDGSLTVAPSGDLLAAVTPIFQPRDCGRIVRYDPVNGSSSVDVIAGRVACVQPPLVSHSPSFAFAYAGETLYAADDDDVACPPATRGYPFSCGALLRFDGLVPRVVSTFDSPDSPEPLWGRYPQTASIYASGARLPGHIFLTMTAYGSSHGPFYVRTATSRLALRSVDVPASSPIPVFFEQDTTRLDSLEPKAQAWTGKVSLRVTTLTSGMYRIDLAHYAPVVTDANGYPVDATQQYILPIYFAPAPSATPALRAGQRFIEFSQPTGAQPSAAPGLRIQTLKTVDPSTPGGVKLGFESEDGTTESVDAQSADVFSIAGLAPIVNDADVDALSKKYEGRDVYPIGDFWPLCVFSNGTEGEGIFPNAAARLHVRTIVRLYGISASWGIGPNILRTLDSGSDYVTAGPIIVVFDKDRVDRALVNQAFAGYGGCAAFYGEFSGSWDFERMLSLKSVAASHPEWSPTIAAEVKDHKVVVGMTRAMIIASVGYPSDYGTAAQMMKLDTWDYDMPSPFQYTVYFKDDTVVKYDPPGQLP